MCFFQLIIHQLCISTNFPSSKDHSTAFGRSFTRCLTRNETLLHCFARSSWWRFQELKGLDVLRFLQELVALVNMLHILSYGQQGGWRVGGCDNVLDENNTGPTELVAAALSLWPRLCRKHFGTDASRGEEKWMDDLVDVCMGNLKIINF